MFERSVCALFTFLRLRFIYLFLLTFCCVFLFVAHTCALVCQCSAKKKSYVCFLFCDCFLRNVRFLFVGLSILLGLISNKGELTLKVSSARLYVDLRMLFSRRTLIRSTISCPFLSTLFYDFQKILCQPPAGKKPFCLHTCLMAVSINQTDPILFRSLCSQRIALQGRPVQQRALSRPRNQTNQCFNVDQRWSKKSVSRKAGAAVGLGYVAASRCRKPKRRQRTAPTGPAGADELSIDQQASFQGEP